MAFYVLIFLNICYPRQLFRIIKSLLLKRGLFNITRTPIQVSFLNISESPRSRFLKQSNAIQALLLKNKQDAIKEWTFKYYFSTKDSYLRVHFKHPGVDFFILFSNQYQPSWILKHNQGGNFGTVFFGGPSRREFVKIFSRHLGQDFESYFRAQGSNLDLD